MSLKVPFDSVILKMAWGKGRKWDPSLPSWGPGHEQNWSAMMILKGISGHYTNPMGELKDDIFSSLAFNKLGPLDTKNTNSA